MEKRTNTGVVLPFSKTLAGQVGDVFSGGELAMGTGTTGVHDALGDALATETLQLLQQLHVLQQGRAVGSGGLGILVVADRRAIVAGQRSSVGRQRKEARGKDAQRKARWRGAKGHTGHG